MTYEILYTVSSSSSMKQKIQQINKLWWKKTPKASDFFRSLEKFSQQSLKEILQWAEMYGFLTITFCDQKLTALHKVLDWSFHIYKQQQTYFTKKQLLRNSYRKYRMNIEWNIEW